MSYQDLTLAELRRLISSLEAPDGGVSDLDTEALAFVGRTAELVEDAAGKVLHLVKLEAHKRLTAQEAKTLISKGSSITRSFSNQYAPKVDELRAAITKLDGEAAADLFEFVPEVKPEPVPAHFKVANTTRLVNWINKLGLSAERQNLEKLLGKTEVKPVYAFKSVDPESGEVLE